MRVSAAFAWRFLVVVAAVAAVVWLIGKLSLLAITLAIGLLLAALMAPLVDLLMGARLPRGLAAAIAIVGGLAVLGGLLTFVVVQFADGLPELQKHLNQSLEIGRAHV